MARQAATAAGDSAQAPRAKASAPKGSRTTGRGAAGEAISHEHDDPLSPSSSRAPSTDTSAPISVGPQKVVGYIRVSTSRQGRSGLGMEAQAKAIADFCKQH